MHRNVYGHELNWVELSSVYVECSDGINNIKYNAEYRNDNGREHSTQHSMIDKKKFFFLKNEWFLRWVSPGVPIIQYIVILFV